MDRIPGTDLPDTALHRASLWFNRFSGLEDGGPPQERTWREVRELHERVLAECHLEGKITADEIREGAQYYGDNIVDGMFGPVCVTVLTPVGQIDVGVMLRSLWLDGLMHGIALRDGKRGLSNAEIIERAAQ